MKCPSLYLSCLLIVYALQAVKRLVLPPRTLQKLVSMASPPRGWKSRQQAAQFLTALAGQPLLKAPTLTLQLNDLLSPSPIKPRNAQPCTTASALANVQPEADKPKASGAARRTAKAKGGKAAASKSAAVKVEAQMQSEAELIGILGAHGSSVTDSGESPVNFPQFGYMHQIGSVKPHAWCAAEDLMPPLPAPDAVGLNTVLEGLQITIIPKFENVKTDGKVTKTAQDRLDRLLDALQHKRFVLREDLSSTIQVSS